jgi:hypothetical protein
MIYEHIRGVMTSDHHCYLSLVDYLTWEWVGQDKQHEVSTAVSPHERMIQEVSFTVEDKAYVLDPQASIDQGNSFCGL